MPVETEWTIADYEEKQHEFNEYLSSLPSWRSILTINRDPFDAMKDGCLVRYQGMVQDVLNPEYFFTTYNVKNKLDGVVSSRCGRYRDLLYCSDSEELADEYEIESGGQDVRHPLFCIPMPGINSWAADISSASSNLNVGRSCGTKRAHGSDAEESAMEVDEQRSVRRRNETQSTAVTSLRYNTENYFPCPETIGLACIIKHYGGHEDWLVNTRIEAVGFLSVSPALEAAWEDCDAEDRAMHPPPSLVPRLHAVALRKVLHCNPLLLSHPANCDLDMSAIRSDLLTTLTQLLFGDTIAAEYLLCNLLSSVYARKAGHALGSLSLNLFNLVQCPSYPHLLYQFLQTLLPCSVLVPLTIDLLNTAPFVPRKDYETNKLQSGRLQLAEDTLLMVDETVMAEGRLNEAGLRNMAALHSLALHQELRYDFQYFQLDFHTNIPLIVLSEGKSIIPTNAPLKVLPEPEAIATIGETFEAGRFFLSGARLDAVRQYVTLLRLRECDMTQTDFVGPSWAELRQEDGKLRQDDLHQLLVLARLLALSSGEPALTRPHWDKAVDLEKQRRSRVS